MTMKEDIYFSRKDSSTCGVDTHFCTNCQTTRPKAYGEYRNTGTTRRWRCAACVARAKVREAPRAIS